MRNPFRTDMTINLILQNLMILLSTLTNIWKIIKTKEHFEIYKNTWIFKNWKWMQKLFQMEFPNLNHLTNIFKEKKKGKQKNIKRK